MHQVRALLMGGQACVFYGAAEFSRDTDLLLLLDADNLERLHRALRELQAECIAVPPLAADFLERGHAVHFRSQHPEAAGMRVIHSSCTLLPCPSLRGTTKTHGQRSS